MDIPPNPSKNEASIILIDIVLIWIFAIAEMPLVISKIPVKTGLMNTLGICKTLKNGIKNLLTILKKWLWLRIETITENITTKPPIISIVEVALDIELANTSPKLLKEILLEL